jgi:hypothetical protein
MHLQATKQRLSSKRNIQNIKLQLKMKLKLFFFLWMPLSIFAQNSVTDTTAITVTIEQFDSLVNRALHDSVETKKNPTPEQYLRVLRIAHLLSWNHDFRLFPPKAIYVLFRKTYTVWNFILPQKYCLGEIESGTTYYSPAYKVMIGRPNEFNSRYHLTTEFRKR